MSDTKIERILVTGGAGYIGSVVVSALLNNGFKVIVLDKLSFGGEGLLNNWHNPNFMFIKGDLTDQKFVSRVFDDNKIDGIVHLAAIVGDPACAKQPKLAEEINYQASVRLIEIAQKKKVERFVFASTCSNYGKMSDPGKYLNEDSELKPVSLYAELKVKVEKHIFNEVQRDTGFSPTVLRFATVYGISPRMRFDLTVNEFAKEMSQRKELLVFGEQFWRPYCHVFDFGRAISSVLKSEKEKISFNVFNIGDTNENYQKKMIIDEVIKLIPDAKVKYVHKDEDPRDYKVAFEKVKNQLGFNISRRVPDGIREIKYMIENRLLMNPDDPKYKNI